MQTGAGEGDRMSRNLLMGIRAAAFAALLVPLAAMASGGGARLQSAPIDGHDVASLQNGARIFVNYCLNCHSAGYMRYNRLQDLGLTEQQIRDNLIFTGVKVGELMQVAMNKNEAKEWFGTTPPDLTVTARSRSSAAGSGADWIYAYLRAFYRDSSRPTGWNNLVYESVAMPHALWQLNGQAELKVEKFSNEEAAHAAYIAAKSVARLDQNVSMVGGKETRGYTLKTLQPGSGTLSPFEYDKAVADLVNYMNYMAEPMRFDRRQAGIYVLFLLGILLVFALMLKKAYWKDVH
jgi:ubiquinol-cytochrome c reductase cytochrome c1 subunit